MNAFYELINEAHKRLGTSPEDDFWDGSIDHIYDLIQHVEFDIARNNLMLTFNRLVSYAKKKPAEKALSYNELREAVLRLVDTVPELDEKIREEIGIPDFNFEWITDEMTEEQILKQKEDKKARRDEWLKKNKKKPKSEEEEHQDMQNLKQLMSDEIKQRVLTDSKILGGIEDKIEMMELKRLLNEHVIMDKNKWDELYRKKSILDIGCEGKNVLLRLDLDVPLSEYVSPLDEEVKTKVDTKVGAKIATDSQVGTTSRVGTTVRSSPDNLTSKFESL